MMKPHCLVLTLLTGLVCVAEAQNPLPAQVSSIYCFGFSWTDTHNCSWSPTQYYRNRACNGPMWPEFLSTKLGLAYPEANNYAHCGATSGDILNQIAQAKLSGDLDRSLFFVWEGNADFLYLADASYSSPSGDVSYVNPTNEVAWANAIQKSVKNSSNAVERLYAKGARSIVIQSGFDMSEAPAIISDYGRNTNRLAKLRERTAEFNTLLAAALDHLRQSKPDSRLYFVDNFSHLTEIYTNAATYGFTKAFPDALDDSTLNDKSLGGPGAEYVFWDHLHASSKLNELIAAWNLDVLTNFLPEQLEAGMISGSPMIQMNHLQVGREYILQQSANLKTWNDLQTFTAGAGTNRWLRSAGNESVAYFRLKWKPGL